MNIPLSYASPSDFFDVKKAECLGVNIVKFYPDKPGGARKGSRSDNNGLEICRECEVVKPCLEYALRYEALGIWGGTGEVEREMIRRERNIYLPPDRTQSASVRRAVTRGSFGYTMLMRQQSATG